MRIHRYTTLQYSSQGQFSGIGEIVLHDFNHALSATLTHAECINFFFAIGELLRSADGVTPLLESIEQPAGFRMDQGLRLARANRYE